MEKKSSGKLDVLYLITKSNWGGAQRYVYDLAVAATKTGKQVAVACGGEGELVRRLEEAGVTVYPLAQAGRDIRVTSDVAVFVTLVRMLRTLHPLVLHINSSKMGGLGVLAGRIAGVPKIIFTAHGFAFNEERPRWQKVLIWILTWCTIVLSHKSIAVSDATLLQVSHLPFVRKKLIRIYSGVSPFDGLSKEVARAELTQKIGIHKHPKDLWIGCVAELHPTKRHLDLLHAFAIVHTKLPHTRLFLLGNGEQLPAIRKTIATLNLDKRVHLLGYVSQASRYMRAFDVVTLQSRTEALPFAPLEAASAGVPVVAASVGGVPEIVIDHKTGLLVPCCNPEKLAEALYTLLSDEKLREQYGKEATLHVANTFPPEKMLRETLALYDK